MARKTIENLKKHIHKFDIKTLTFNENIIENLILSRQKKKKKNLN